MVKAGRGAGEGRHFLIAVGLVLNGLTVYSGKGQRQHDFWQQLQIGGLW